MKERLRDNPCPESRIKSDFHPPVDKNSVLNPDWVEWLMGWPIGWTDPAQNGIQLKVWEE